MTTTLNVTKEISKGQWKITAAVGTGSDIPTDIFVYENSGEGLGEYFGVATVNDYKRTQAYTGTPIAVFGNKYVRYTTATHYIAMTSDPEVLIAKISADVKSFRAEFLSGYSVSTIITIS